MADMTSTPEKASACCGPDAEASLLRVNALRNVSTGQPCWSRSEAAMAASRAFTSRAVPCFAVFRKISATSPFSNLPTPAVYRMPPCSKLRSS